ncbi:MAG: BamA/TamA family outer membrane protein [Symploca sp. SIO2B6]|nr:BamA/TamA family outer membrane protein [Symploca sp. SIO2B6]
MLNKTLVISSLSILAVGELTQEAIASPVIDTSTAKPTARNYVVPAQAISTTPSVVAVTPPEAVVAQPEFVESTGVREQRNREVEKDNLNSTPVPEETLSSSSSTKIAAVLDSIKDPDLAVTATDVKVVGVTEELQPIVLRAIGTRPGSATSQSKLASDIEAILNTGFFADARVTHNSNQDGWDVVYEVEPIVMQSLQLIGNQVLTSEVANEFLKSQLGAPVSPVTLRQSLQKLEQWYADNGYVLAQVLDVQSRPDGVVTIEVAEGIVKDINFRFLDQDGDPTKGRTREDFITSELKLQPGEVFSAEIARQDLQKLYRSGLFETVDISLDGNASNVDVTYELSERQSRGVNLGAGYSNDSGLFGTLSYQDQNFSGLNQKLGLDVQVGSGDVQFGGNYTNPYRASNPGKLGYNLNAFRRRGLSRTFDGDVELANGDQPREGKFGGGIAFTRPLNQWDASFGLDYTRTSIRDGDGEITPFDEFGNPLAFSETGIDDLVTINAGLKTDRRDNPVNPTQGSLLSFNTEQSVPIGSGSILMNRLQANYSLYEPIRLFGSEKPEVLAFNLQAGTTIGDLPPYRAFNLGGINSVRGYGSGDVGSGRSFVSASAEYRVPVYKPLSAVVFADFASDLGSGDTVPGEPGVVRDKPGTGFGYGAGLRLNSPLGILRADYAFNDEGNGKLQFGIGQRF